MLSVTDISQYLYCPRRFYLEKVKGIKKPPNKAMIKGMIRHQIVEEFSNNEKHIITSLTDNRENRYGIIMKFQNTLNRIIKQNFLKNQSLINKFSISENELKEQINKSMNKEILLRTSSVLNTLRQGFLGNALWYNLTPKYISEMRLFSQNLNLKGRADRVMFSNIRDIENSTIIPYELKTRATDKVWPSDKIQITSYAILLEEKYNKKISLGILEAGDNKTEIPITQDLRDKTLNLISEIRSLLTASMPTKEQLKHPSNFSKCRKCEYKKDCEDMEQ